MLFSWRHHRELQRIEGWAHVVNCDGLTVRRSRSVGACWWRPPFRVRWFSIIHCDAATPMTNSVALIFRYFYISRCFNRQSDGGQTRHRTLVSFNIPMFDRYFSGWKIEQCSLLFIINRLLFFVLRVSTAFKCCRMISEFFYAECMHRHSPVCWLLRRTSGIVGDGSRSRCWTKSVYHHQSPGSTALALPSSAPHRRHSKLNTKGKKKLFLLFHQKE